MDETKAIYEPQEHSVIHPHIRGNMQVLCINYQNLAENNSVEMNNNSYN